VRQLETRLTPSIITLGSFDGTDGKWPGGAMVLDSSGNLYGATSEGGPVLPGPGTLFEVAHHSGQVSELAQFGQGFGYHPSSGLIADGSGNLYGAAASGGPSGDGTIFGLAHGSGPTLLAAFNGTNGSGPGRLVVDSSGNVYGTTFSGGASNDGTVFEVPHASGAVTVLASFDGSNGVNPAGGGLVMDSSDNLYGTTRSGGAAGDGTVFEVAQGSGTITTLASFNGTDGANPESAALVIDRSGNLYGGTGGGGASGDGTLFELAQGSGTITTLASFNGTNGAGAGNLVMDSSGDLYGTSGGGAYRVGTVFELPKGSGTITTLASFDGPDGKFASSLLMDTTGNLYGATRQGGANNDGTVFELPGGAIPADQWTGANFAVDTNWSDGANWALGAPPTAGQRALFTKAPDVKSFTATVDAGFTNSIAGLDIDSSWNGTITVNSALTVTGDFSLSSGRFGGKGAVTIEGGISQWTGGRIVVGAGGFTNTGTLYADTTTRNPILTGSGVFTNDGTIYEAGTNGIMVENGATLDNAAGATFDLTADGGLGQSGGGTFTNAGTLEKTGGTGASTIATTTLDNPGTITVSTGALDIAAAVTQVAGGTLKGGHWKMTGTSTVSATLDITSAGNITTLGSGATVTLSGPNTSFSNLIDLTTINEGGSLSLLGRQSFTTAVALTNNGALTLSPNSVLTVGGSFTQSSTGSLTVELGGPSAAPTFGQVFSTSGTVALAGSLTVTSTIVPAVGSSFTILENEGNSAISGDFAGLPEGGTFTVTVGTTTMTFQISYVGSGTFGDNNVVITRTT
jgi:uncharacterized repeat protein (TIGR03803 family)